MSLSVCPADTVAAPIETVWEILTQPEYYSTWADAQLQKIEPAGAAVVGQTVSFTSKALGRSWPLLFTIEKVDTEKHQLGLDAVFPLGLRMRPHISCTRVDAVTTLVRYG
jgi:hypothetical protein